MQIAEDSDDDDDVSVEDGDTRAAAKGPAAEGGSQHGPVDPASEAVEAVGSTAEGALSGDGYTASRDEAGRSVTRKIASFEVQPTAGAGEKVGAAAAGGVAEVGREVAGQQGGGADAVPAGKGGGRKPARRSRVGRGGHVVNGKVLVSSPWRTVKFMVRGALGCVLTG